MVKIKRRKTRARAGQGFISREDAERLLSEYLAEIGRRGGKAGKGVKKTRPPGYYQAIGATGGHAGKGKKKPRQAKPQGAKRGSRRRSR